MTLPKPAKHLWSLQGLLAPVRVEQHVKQLDGMSLFLPSMCSIPNGAFVVRILWPVTVLQIFVKGQSWTFLFKLNIFFSNTSTCNGAVIPCDLACILQLFSFLETNDLYFWGCHMVQFCSVKLLQKTSRCLYCAI